LSSLSLTIDDLREAARRRVPRAFFEYADAGSYSESTLRANRADLERITLRQRVGIDVAQRDLTTMIVGEPASLPLVLAPVGLCGMQIGDGEILACRAAQAVGIPFCLSTMSICSIEDVAAAVEKPFWFQAYVMRDRAFVREMIERAIAAHCSALVVTLDLNVLGQRHRDIKNGLAVPLRFTLRNLLDVATKPAWALSVLRGKRRTFGNVAGHVRGMDDVTSLAAWISKQFDPSLDWKDVEWIRSLWSGKMILKGIMDPQDAKIARSIGVSAIVVSISALPAIVEAVGSDVEIMMDSGIRSGQDVLRALALGARSCMIGRAYIYGLGAAGEAGVMKAIDIIRDELDTSMALTGTRSASNVDPNVIAAIS
jgi:L-lactate dehydrogenase (cytochrome)